MGRTSGLVVALDLDGTLIDARVRQVGVAAEALRELTGEELPRLRFWRAKRSGATTADALAKLGYPSSVVAGVTARWSERIETTEWLARDRPLPSAASVLRRLGGLGTLQIVLTARRDPDGAAVSLAAAGLADLVDEVIVVAPSGVVEEKAAALRRWAPVGFVGDSETDGSAARAAEVPFAAVATGQRSRTYLEARGFAPHRSLPAAVQDLIA